MRAVIAAGIGAWLLLGPARVDPTHRPPESLPPAKSLSELAGDAAGAAKHLSRLHSLLASVDGELVLETYPRGSSRYRTHNIKSASKSMIGAMVGIALREGWIESLDEPIASYFPRRLGPTVDDPRKRDITVEHLLTMRSGLVSTSGGNYGAWASSRSFVGWSLSQPLVDPPGARMNYSTGSSHLLSAVLTRASGRSTWEIGQQYLAEPLGFDLPRWQRDPEGFYLGGNNMAMTPRQMLAVGELYLNGGVARGRRVLPEGWVEASCTPRGRSHRSGRLYGYGWWIDEIGGHETCFAWGYGGQYIFVVPSLDLVVVATSSTDSRGRRGYRRSLFDVIVREIIEPLDLRSRQGPRLITRNEPPRFSGRAEAEARIVAASRDLPGVANRRSFSRNSD